MRLIDADAIKIPKGFFEKVNNVPKFYEWLDGQPTVERNHGEWMFSPDDAEGVCSICQYKIYGRPYQGRYLIVPYNFCPNCGADMRGENNG
jgi:hypothetical protein